MSMTTEKPMYKCVFVNGGAGRMISAIPALEKFIQKNPDSYIITEAGLDFILGNRLLQDRTYEANTKGIFENIIKHAEIITTEPYRDWEYYNQKISLAQAFDKQINGSYGPAEEYKVKLCLNKDEELHGVAVIKAAKEKHGKDKTIILQPFGRGIIKDDNLSLCADHGSRSIELSSYLKIITALKGKYNLVSMCEFEIPGDDITLNPKDLTLRKWAAIIEQCDYFIGCDSVGQHIARGYDKPGTVILGSTFAVNVTYPNYFNIIEKEGFTKRYDPIRISEWGSAEAGRLNDHAMTFDDNELDKIINNILKDIEKKVGG